LLPPILVSDTLPVGDIQFDTKQNRLLVLANSRTWARLYSVPLTPGEPARQLQEFQTGGPFDWAYIFSGAVDPVGQMYYLLASNPTASGAYYLTAIDISAPNTKPSMVPITCPSGPSGPTSGMFPQMLAWDSKNKTLISAIEGMPKSGGFSVTQVWSIKTSGTCASTSFSMLPPGNHEIIDCWAYDPQSRSFFFSVPEGTLNPPGAYIEQVNVDTGSIKIFATLADEMFPDNMAVWNQ